MAFAMMGRRAFLGAVIGLAAQYECDAQTPFGSLRAAAASKGLLYGAAVQREQLQTDADFLSVVARETSIIVPEWEMKWRSVEPTITQSGSVDADWLVQFARACDLKIRGHTLVWHRSLPEWVVGDPSFTLSKLEESIRRRVERYQGKLHSIDVVNEAIDTQEHSGDLLRNSFLLQRFGPDYIEKSFRFARQADSAVPLYYNDYGVDYDDSESEARRRGILKLLTKLCRSGTPVNGVGIQAHLFSFKKYSEKKHRSFLKEISDLGLEILITELDIRDRRPFPISLADRDHALADHLKAYISVALDEPAVKGVLTWGLSDRYSWLNATRGGAEARGLPFDRSLKAKPIWSALHDAFVSAPSR